jgi:dihydroxyacid dehydratase/phosphogluconate dehydratase
MPYNRRSKNITQGVARSPNRSMYYAIGYQKEDFDKPMIGIANGHSTITPCNAGLQRLADAAVAAVKGADANPQVFGTPTISDGMSMGTEGMKYSLVSREVIADSIETCVQGQWMDGVVVIGGCDKNMPGGMIGMLRTNVPSIYVYGGTIRPGNWKGTDLTIVSSFEAVGEFTAGRMSQEDFDGIVRRHVHRQHDELVVRGARHVAAVFVDDGQSGSGKGRLGSRIGTRAGGSSQEGSEAARYRHEEVDRERRGRADGNRRLDQCRAALPGHRARG